MARRRDGGIAVAQLARELPLALEPRGDVLDGDAQRRRCALLVAQRADDDALLHAIELGRRLDGGHGIRK